MGNSNGYTEILKDRQGNDVVHHSFLPRGATEADRQAYIDRMRAYWTPERMALANPVPVPGEENSQPQESGEADDAQGENIGDYTTNLVPNATLAPFSSVGRFFGELDGYDYFSSASCVGSQIIMAAAHAVYPPSEDAFVQNLVFAPQYANGQPGAPGTFVATDVYVYDRWVSGETLLPAWEIDYAFVTLNAEMPGVPALPIDFSPPGDAPRAMLTAGYPYKYYNATYPYDGQSMWETVTTSTKKWLTWYESLKIYMPTAKGWSGGPWIDSTTLQVYGLNSYTKGPRHMKMFSPTLGPRAEVLFRSAQNSSSTWTTPLAVGPGPTHALIVGSSVYVSCPVNGRIYQLDAGSGSLQNTQMLTGYGNHPVAMDSDGTNLYAGVYGYLASIPLTNFTVAKPVFSNLPNSGFNDVTVLCSHGKVFAASNGVGFMVTDLSTMSVAATTFSGFGSGNMAMACDGTSLYLASNSMVAQIPLGNFGGNATWFKSLTPIGALAGPMKVAMVGSTVCATVNGALFTLDSATGNLLNTWPLSNFELVPMATDDFEMVFLFKVLLGIGTENMTFSVVAINVPDNEIVWTTQLAVPVAATLMDVPTMRYVKDMVIVGFNGSVYVVRAEDGAVVNSTLFAQTDLFLGTYIAASPDGMFVAAGINGVGYGWTLIATNPAPAAEAQQREPMLT